MIANIILQCNGDNNGLFRNGAQRAIWRKMNLDPYPYTIYKDQIWKVKKLNILEDNIGMSSWTHST